MRDFLISNEIRSHTQVYPKEQKRFFSKNNAFLMNNSNSDEEQSDSDYLEKKT